MFADVESDRRWFDDQREWGWKLPPRAPWPLRLPIVRAIRAAWLSSRADRHFAAFRTLGMARGGYDAWVVYAIARGWA